MLEQGSSGCRNLLLRDRLVVIIHAIVYFLLTGQVHSITLLRWNARCREYRMRRCVMIRVLAVFAALSLAACNRQGWPVFSKVDYQRISAADRSSTSSEIS